MIPPKPDDFGDGASAASYLPGGEWLAITRPSPEHGMVELTGAPIFPETSRGVPDAVRQYRTSLTRAETAFLLPSASSELSVTASGSEHGTLWLSCQPTRDLSPGELYEVRVRFAGRLQRPPYTEITDIAPLTPLAEDSRWDAEDGVLVVRSAVLDARANISIEIPGGSEGRWIVDESGATWVGRTTIRRDLRPALVLRCELVTGVDDDASRRPIVRPQDDGAHRRIAPTSFPIDADLAEKLEQIVEGARKYILHCCALSTSPSESVILTDHRLLPLSWTRDAYYMALLLLLCGDKEAVTTVERHLRWLWGPAHAAGPWMRSHLATGEVKDPGLQADQQLFPILELVDFRRATGAWPARAGNICSASWGQQIESALSALPVHQGTGLLMSDENPADDASGMPLLFSTQVLFAHVLDRLAQFAEELELTGSALEARATSIRSATRAIFTVNDADALLFAYEADGHGGRRLYGDANDIPTALAPAWGFCPPDDPVWLHTMDFVFSPRNPGWSAGPFGGLGSAHTPGTWPLGDVQKLVVCQTLGDSAGTRACLERVADIASHDGLLPETYDSQTGAWSARHWFGWPSAAAAAAILSLDWAPSPLVRRETPERPATVRSLDRS